MVEFVFCFNLISFFTFSSLFISSAVSKFCENGIKQINLNCVSSSFFLGGGVGTLGLGVGGGGGVACFKPILYYIIRNYFCCFPISSLHLIILMSVCKLRSGVEWAP